MNSITPLTFLLATILCQTRNEEPNGSGRFFTYCLNLFVLIDLVCEGVSHKTSRDSMGIPMVECPKNAFYPLVLPNAKYGQSRSETTAPGHVNRTKRMHNGNLTPPDTKWIFIITKERLLKPSPNPTKGLRFSSLKLVI